MKEKKGKYWPGLITRVKQKQNGGLSIIEEQNRLKANHLYKEIERNQLFEGVAKKDDRSGMNVCFLLKDESLKEKFDNLCSEAGIVGINGHRSVGGYRASIYNALPFESVKILTEVMNHLD